MTSDSILPTTMCQGVICCLLQAFPERQCFKMPTLLLLAVGAAMLLLSAAISFFQSLAATELDPDSRDLLALAHAK